MSKFVISIFTAAVGAAVVVSLLAAPPAPDAPVIRLMTPETSGSVAGGSAGTAHPSARDRRPEPARIAEGPASEPAEASGAAERPAAPTGTGSPRTLSLEDAVRELSLIRPSREKAASDFSLKTADGKTFRLSEHRGKVVFVNFWATWCPPCKEEMPAMDRLYRKHRDRGFVMVAVSVDSDPAVVQPFLDEHQFAFPVALDPRMETANAYAVRALPSSFIIDARGMMTALALGPRVWDGTAANALIEALAR